MQSEVVKIIESGVWPIIFKVILVLIVFNMLKSISSKITGYITFKLNPYSALGRRVVVDDFEGHISRISLTTIMVENEDQHYTIDTSRWKWSSWTYFKNS